MQPITKKSYRLSIFGCQSGNSVSEFLHIGFICGAEGKSCVVLYGVLKDELLVVTSTKCVCVIGHAVRVN